MIMVKSEAEKKAKKEREEAERLQRLTKAGYIEKASNPECISCQICRWRIGNNCSNPRIRSKISLKGACKYFAAPLITKLPEECKKL